MSIIDETHKLLESAKHEKISSSDFKKFLKDAEQAFVKLGYTKNDKIDSVATAGFAKANAKGNIFKIEFTPDDGTIAFGFKAQNDKDFDYEFETNFDTSYRHLMKTLAKFIAKAKANESVKQEAMPPKSKRKRIDFEDDLVKVYQGNKEIYSGIEDYEPMKDADWRWDNNDKCYKYDKYVKICFESAKSEMMTSELPKDYMPVIKKELGNEVKLVQVDHGDKCDRAGVIIAHNKSSNKFSLYIRNRFRKGDKLTGTWTQLIQKKGYDVYNAVKGKEKQELTDSIVREILDYWLSLMKRYDRSGNYRTNYSDWNAEVRYWGSWEGDDGSGDYDWQVLTDEWKEKLYNVRQDVKKKFPAFADNISISTEEKNWIVCSIWPKR